MTLRRNGSGKIRENSKSTDNSSVSQKRYLRRRATSHLETLRVLDLFAGKGLLWRDFATEKYVAVEIDESKNQNAIHTDNRKLIPRIDLSKFNVIDLDSYGVPADQIKLIYDNKTLQDGTVIIYTCISNKVSTIPSTLARYASISRGLYEKAQTLFNGWSTELFFDYLASLGVDKVIEYEHPSHEHGYTKKYGYFVV